VPSAFEHVVQRAMAKDAAARYQSVQELGRALLPFVGERTRINYEHELVVPGGGPHTTQPFDARPAYKPISTLDPTANSVALERRRSALPLRTLLLVIGAIALVGGGVIGLSMRGAERAADEDPTVITPSAATSAPPASTAEPAAEAKTGTAAATPTGAPTPTAVPAKPEAAAGAAVTAVDGGASADVAPLAKPEKAGRRRNARRTDPKRTVAPLDAPTPAPRPPSSDPFSERK
jgi:hypothetical protein